MVISAGHTIERKGILDYIALARRMPWVKFIWFGHTPEHLVPRPIRKEVANAPPNLFFSGFVGQEELRDAYCGADVFAFLSPEETEGTVVLEALSCGIPVVLRDIPVYRGWLEDGVQVWMARDTPGFEQRIRGVLSGTLPDLTTAGREAVRERSLEAVGEQLKQIHEGKLPEAKRSQSGKNVKQEVII